MPERVTKEERMVTLAIEKARKTIETMRESTQVIPVDTEVEVQKIKRPKVQDASKITNQTQDKEGYGLAGESLKKAKFQGPPEKFPFAGLKGKLDAGLFMINLFIKDKKTLNEEQVEELKKYVKKAMQDLDEVDKYSISRTDEEDLRVKD